MTSRVLTLSLQQQQQHETCPDQKEELVEQDDDTIEETYKGNSFDWNEAGMNRARELEEENENLLVTLEMQRKQIDDLRDALEAAKPIAGLNPKSLLNVVMPDGTVQDQDLRDIKIVHLAKKSRKLQMKLNRSNACVVELERLVKEMREENKKKEEEKKINDETSRVEKRDENKEERLKQIISRLRLKHQNEQELRRKYHKILIREVGSHEDVNAALAGSSSNWKGRASTIASLKAKISRLEQQPMIQNKTASSSSPKGLRNLEQTRRKQNELNRVELREAKSTIETLRKELKGTKARAETLRKEAHRARESMRSMLEKDENNNELIEELETILEGEEQKSRDLAVEVDKLRNLQGCEDENRHLRDLNEKLQAKIQRIHDRSVKEGRELRSRVRELENRLNSRQSVPSPSSTTTNNEEKKWMEKIRLLEEEMHEIKQSCRRKIMEKNDEIRKLRKMVKKRRSG